MLFVVIGFSIYSPNTCYRIKYKIKIVKLVISNLLIVR
jgi:hypothetical protein